MRKIICAGVMKGDVVKKSSNSKRSSQKRRMAKAAGDKVRKRMARQMVAEYMKVRRHQVDHASLDGDGGIGEVDDGTVGIDAVVKIANCDGVGACCKDRYIPVEPSDVWRLLRNERVRKKWGVVHTGDLYGEGKPLFFDIDEALGVPGCAVVRVEQPGVEETVCPFFDGGGDVPGCILGDDRLTYCKADPITRTARVMDKRRLDGWVYVNNDMPCLGCLSASPDGDREVSVREWLNERGLEERYRLTDVFYGFIAWFRRNEKFKTTFYLRLASMLLFSWHDFLIVAMKEDPKDVPWEEPCDPEIVVKTAYAILESMSMDGSHGGGVEAGSGSQNVDLS